MEAMDRKLCRRIREGAIQRQDVVRRLGELAYGRANDCVRLVLEENLELETLDLSLLSEVKRNEKGTVEIRLLDRLRILEQLAAMTEGGETGAQALLQALRGGEQE
ncbi:MAG: hypothetical protein IJD98_03740 [Oscillospiraceae bacterium]|nr:hypothetical protein [Oscillospiraceae bacterium]